MLRFALPSVLLLSTMVASQTATMQVRIAPPDSTPFPSVILSCFGRNSASITLADRVPPAASRNLDICAQGKDLPTEINQTEAGVANATDLPEAPSESARGPNEPKGRDDTKGGDDTSGTRFVPAALSAEPNMNKSVHTVDRSFILLQTLSAVALIVDLETTARSFEGQPKLTELNPVFGAHPTRARLYGIAVPLNVLSFYASYRYKKIEPGRKTWKIAPGLCIAIHTAAAINNLIATR